MKYQRNCENADTALEVEHEDDLTTLTRISREALPIAERIFGKDDRRYRVFSSSFQDLQGKRYGKNGNVTTGARYNPETINTALCMLKEFKPRAFESIAEVLYLPNERYLRGVLKQAIGNNDDGAQMETIVVQYKIWKEWAEKNPTKSKGWEDISLEYDSMRIAPGMVLLRRKEEKYRIQGAILPESMDIATRLFDQFVFKIAGERGFHSDVGEEGHMEEGPHGGSF
jgi:hypothetical protein